ncbi:MAG: aminodeoxychorismate/anthranilate synthase component II [Candidatus Omnitrophota bacterium]
MILVIDNYDSFTYNLVQYLGELGEKLVVKRNDKITLSEIEEAMPERIVISPGPGTPKDAGISREVIKNFANRIPMLGVCLGHQCIGEVYGGKILRAPTLMHGKTSLVYHDDKDIFQDVENPFEATRYHSLIVSKRGLPRVLKVIAHTKEGEIMGLKHVHYPLWGVQFHPESILTKEGKKILVNFLKVR